MKLLETIGSRHCAEYKSNSSRVAAKAKRFGLASASNPRCRPAVGGGGAAGLDTQVHSCALQMGEGVELTLTSLCEKDDEDRTFVSAQNYHAITRRHDLERDWGDIAFGQACSPISRTRTGPGSSCQRKLSLRATAQCSAALGVALDRHHVPLA